MNISITLKTKGSSSKHRELIKYFNKEYGTDEDGYNGGLYENKRCYETDGKTYNLNDPKYKKLHDLYNTIGEEVSKPYMKCYKRRYFYNDENGDTASSTGSDIYYCKDGEETYNYSDYLAMSYITFYAESPFMD